LKFAEADRLIFNNLGERKGKGGAAMKKRILLIDDDADIRELFAISFQIKGYEVFLAEDGQRGIEMVNSDPRFDLVITDRQMPRMLGEEVIRSLKLKYPYLKIVLMTANLNPAIAAVAEAAGADLVIEKSGDLPDIIHTFLTEGISE